MSSTTLVSVSEYLETSYRPDVDYVDGELLERNVGELDHSRLQGAADEVPARVRGQARTVGAS